MLLRTSFWPFADYTNTQDRVSPWKIISADKLMRENTRSSVPHFLNMSQSFATNENRPCSSVRAFNDVHRLTGGDA